MAFPAFIAALPAPQLFGLAGETTGGTTHHITDKDYLKNEIKGAKKLTRGLTEPSPNHLSRMGLKAENAIHFATQRPTTQTASLRGPNKGAAPI